MTVAAGQGSEIARWFYELIRRNAENAIARILVRTGKRLGQLTGDDVLAYSHIARQSRRHANEHLAWELLVALAPHSGEPPTLRAAWHASMSSRRHTVKILVDRYGIPKSGVRDLLIDYLEELKPNMDYGSLEWIAYRLVRLFWAEVIDIHPDQKDLRLAPAVAAQWRERIQLTLEGRPGSETSSMYFAVRALDRDIAEWSQEEPERWAIWVEPIPLPRAESKAASKQRRQVQARMQQRTRSLTPLLPAFMRSATAARESPSPRPDTRHVPPELETKQGSSHVAIPPGWRLAAEPGDSASPASEHSTSPLWRHRRLV